MTVSRGFVIYAIRHTGNPDLLRTLRNGSPVIERNLRHAPLDAGTPEQRRGGHHRLRMALLARDADEAERWFRAQCQLLGAAGVGVAGPSAAA